MKVCEVCGGSGCQPNCVLCSACDGAGVISLGHESAARHAALVSSAREKAARLGWIEEVWEPLTEAEQREQYPQLARKVYRVLRAVTRESELPDGCAERSEGVVSR